MAEAHLPEGKATAEAGGDSDVLRGFDAFRDLSLDELRKEWRRLYRSQPPRFSRDLLLRAIAYRHQELRYGGPRKAPNRKTYRASAVTAIQRGNSPCERPETPSGCAVGPRMERPHAYCHSGRGRLHLRGAELPVAERNRAPNHRRLLVGPALLWTGRE